MLKHQTFRAQIRARVEKDANVFYDQESPDKWEYEYRMKKNLCDVSPSQKPIKRIPKLEKALKTVNLHHGRKKGIVITARVHPGEPQSSWAVQGLIEFLISDDPAAKSLRKNYIFKIIPMLNPDGVIYGNYRCSLLGFDLNRRWEYPNKYFDPTIYYVKKMIKVFQEEREIKLYCDLHGHSSKRDFFTYGCDYYNTYQKSKYNNFHLRMFPALLNSINPLFNFNE